jgi:hypothetical protein
MRPALIALLICVLLLRQQLESREDYLRFWDHVLDGRTAILLSVAPEDRNRLAQGLYPLVWIAGRYGVETELDAAPVGEAGPAATFATVRISAASPPSWHAIGRLRWTMGVNGPAAAGAGASEPEPALRAALLTILPDEPSTLYVQGTDQDAVRNLFDMLTVSGRFPGNLLQPISAGKAVQMLVTADASGRWATQTWSPHS